MIRSWDEGVTWHLEQVEAPTDDPLELAFVRDQHLRGVNGTAEDDFILHLIDVTTRAGERWTKRAWMPQQWAIVLDRFPWSVIEIPRPPLLEIVSFTYVDEDGVEQSLTAADYQLSAPQGPTCRKGRLAPPVDEVWPDTQTGLLEAVTVTFRCGYETADSPAQPNVPADLKHGQLLVIGELYKQRSDSVIGFGVSVNPAIVRARDLWAPYRIFD